MPARYEQIAEWVNAFGWELGVELGVFDGTTLFYLLDHCPELSMIGIDLWGKTVRHPTAPVAVEKCKCEYCNATRTKRRSTPEGGVEAEVMKRALVEPRARILKANTAHSASLVEGQVDFVFVDGDHSEKGVSNDIAAWKGKIRPGGRLIGHDWNMASVRAGVHRHFDDVQLGDDHVWWVAV